MPGGDRTGPAGLGPMTGRGVGFCAGYSVPGYANPVGGRGGIGMGRGGRRGWRNWCFPAFRATGYYGPNMESITPENELQALRNQAEAMKADLEQINERIAQLDTEKK